MTKQCFDIGPAVLIECMCCFSTHTCCTRGQPDMLAAKQGCRQRISWGRAYLILCSFHYFSSFCGDKNGKFSTCTTRVSPAMVGGGCKVPLQVFYHRPCTAPMHCCHNHTYHSAAGSLQQAVHCSLRDCVCVSACASLERMYNYHMSVTGLPERGAIVGIRDGEYVNSYL